jgi:hypothetical protein
MRLMKRRAGRLARIRSRPVRVAVGGDVRLPAGVGEEGGRKMRPLGQVECRREEGLRSSTASYLRAWRTGNVGVGWKREEGNRELFEQR